MASFVPFQQHEELTTRISNILNEYVVSTSVLRVFVQNADDAGARKFALCLDMASCAAGGGEGLLSPRLPLRRPRDAPARGAPPCWCGRVRLGILDRRIGLTGHGHQLLPATRAPPPHALFFTSRR